MPQLRPDQISHAMQTLGTPAVPIGRLCTELSAARGGGHDVRSRDVYRSAREHPRLFFVLEPALAAWAATWNEEARAEYGAAAAALPPDQEQLVLVDSPEERGAADDTARMEQALVRLWHAAPHLDPGEAPLAEAIRDALDIEQQIARLTAG